jgi:hypothetical protein
VSLVTASPAAAVTANAAPRLDLYSTIHKGLRLFMGDMLARLGRLDLGDPVELETTLAQLGELLALCHQHVVHENQFVHTAIEARRPGASSRIEGEHAQHLDTIAALGADAAALRALPDAVAAHRLYRQFALFVAENLHHMSVEETAHNQALWAAYSDAELLDLHQRLVAAIAPAEMAVVMRWMLPAINPTERAELLGGLQQQLPPEGLRGLLEGARAQLNDTAWAKLARALGMPPVPGLVAV